MRKKVSVSLIPAVAFASWMGLMGMDRSPVKKDERVVFFDTPARLTDDGRTWIVPLHGWIHEPERSRIRRGVLAGLLEERYGLEVTATSRANFDRRVGLFLVDNERGKRLTIRLGGRVAHLPPSEANGHLRGEIRVPAGEVATLTEQRRITYRVVLPEDDERTFAGTAHLIEPTGLSVISDIDDTVKITHVTDRRKMLEQTFLRDFEPVPGMARRYSEWAARGASFHFVSSTPWHLYEPLTEFLRDTGFPPATLHLKLVRLKDRTFWDLFKPGTETKPAQIEPILRAYPGRRFVLVGDSGEHDPEVYGSLLRAHPEQIVRVCIRNVNGASRSDERFGKIFEGIEADRWTLFTDPAALELPEQNPLERS